MRIDQYIQNDSGALSIVTGSALPLVVADQRNDDARFCRDRQALLLTLYGDDYATVRVVVDEPLTADEEAEWVARASAWIEVQDGRALVMGGFDPRTVRPHVPEDGWFEVEHGARRLPTFPRGLPTMVRILDE